MLLVLGVLGLGGVGTFAVTGWGKVVTWLLAHQVLVAAPAHPLLAVPHAGGAGLDLPRLALLAAVVLLLLICLAGAVRRRFRGGGIR